MHKLPHRHADIYKSIESFEEYEFTQCVAYEMAIRNTNIAKLLFEHYTLPYAEDRTNTELYEPPQKDLIAQKLLEKYFIGSDIILDYNTNFPTTTLLNDSINHIKLYAKDKDKSMHKFAFIFQFENLQELYKAAKNEKEYFTHNTYSFLKNHESCRSTFYENKSSITYHYADGLVFYVPLEEKEKQTKDSMIFPIPEGYFKKIFDFKININLQRPKFEISLDSKRTINLELNLALPTDELIAYVKKIKKDFDNDKSLIKTPVELLNDDIINTETITLKQKKSKSQKIADWFFVYDYYQIAKPDSHQSDEIIFGEVDLKLMEYYATDKDYYSIETYKKTIMPKMKYFIEKLGYKELLTGITNKQG